MIGMNRETGREITGVSHLRQSLQDLLTTRKGTRIMRAEYGSDLPELVDLPVNSELVIDIIAETAAAIEKWERRISVTEVKVTTITESRVELAVFGKYLPSGSDVVIDGIVVK